MACYRHSPFLLSDEGRGFSSSSLHCSLATATMIDYLMLLMPPSLPQPHFSLACLSCPAFYSRATSMALFLPFFFLLLEQYRRAHLLLLLLYKKAGRSPPAAAQSRHATCAMPKRAFFLLSSLPCGGVGGSQACSACLPGIFPIHVYPPSTPLSLVTANAMRPLPLPGQNMPLTPPCHAVPSLPFLEQRVGIVGARLSASF